jgi:hypothetical protein
MNLFRIPDRDPGVKKIPNPVSGFRIRNNGKYDELYVQ